MRAWGTVNVLRLPNQSGIRIRGNQGKKNMQKLVEWNHGQLFRGGSEENK